MPPCATGAVVGVEYHHVSAGLKAQSSKVITGCQPGLARTDDHHLRIARPSGVLLACHAFGEVVGSAPPTSADDDDGLAGQPTVTGLVVHRGQIM